MVRVLKVAWPEARSCRQRSPASSNFYFPRDKQIIDVVLFNTELEMLDYRFKLHDRFVKEFLIVESTKTFSGENKPLHAKDNLRNFKNKPSAKVTFVEVPLDNFERAWEREHATRSFAMRWLADRPNELVLMSDVYELLDYRALWHTEYMDGCIVPRLRAFYYCCACHRHDDWR